MVAEVGRRAVPCTDSGSKAFLRQQGSCASPAWQFAHDYKIYDLFWGLSHQGSRATPNAAARELQQRSLHLPTKLTSSRGAV